MEFQMKEGGFSSDFPFGTLEVSGDDTYGFRPYQLMISSIAVCSGGVLRTILRKMRLVVEDIHITADYERNEQEANRIESIHVHFRIKGQNLNEEKIHKAMELTKKNCSMVQSVAGSIHIEETFEIISNNQGRIK